MGDLLPFARSSSAKTRCEGISRLVFDHLRKRRCGILFMRIGSPAHHSMSGPSYRFAGTPEGPLGGEDGFATEVAGRTPSLMSVPEFAGLRVLGGAFNDIIALLIPNIGFDLNKTIVLGLQDDPLRQRAGSHEFSALLIDLPQLFNEQMTWRRIKSCIGLVVKNSAQPTTIVKMNDKPACLATREKIVPCGLVSILYPSSSSSRLQNTIKYKRPDCGRNYENNRA